jgi:hypothetical protein
MSATEASATRSGRSTCLLISREARLIVAVAGAALALAGVTELATGTMRCRRWRSSQGHARSVPRRSGWEASFL